jgi:hypothetical protein
MNQPVHWWFMEELQQIKHGPIEEAEGKSRSTSLGDQGRLCFSVTMFDLMHQVFPGGSTKTLEQYLMFNDHAVDVTKRSPATFTKINALLG